MALSVATLTATPAWAQVDFSGEWGPRFWEDQPERVPGPELGNYLAGEFKDQEGRQTKTSLGDN
jgi:hypothetical protein